MKSVFDGIDRYGKEMGILNASRPHTANIRKQHAGPMMEMGEELPFEDIVAIRKGILEKREEEKCRRVKIAVAILVVSIVAATIIISMYL